MGPLSDTQNCGLRMRRECRERFSCHRGLAILHHGTCATHVPWAMPGSLTRGFLWSRWRGKRSRHSRRMRNPMFYTSGKRPIMAIWAKFHLVEISCIVAGPRFNIKMSPYQYRESHCGDKTVVRSSYLHNGISYTGKTISSHWIRALVLPDTNNPTVIGRFPHKGSVIRKVFPSLIIIMGISSLKTTL